MEVGFAVASRGPLATLDNIVKMTKAGEDMEYDIVSVSDHIVVPKIIDSTYPYNDSGEFVDAFGASSASGEYMDQLTTLSYTCFVVLPMEQHHLVTNTLVFYK